MAPKTLTGRSIVKCMECDTGKFKGDVCDYCDPYLEKINAERVARRMKGKVLTFPKLEILQKTLHVKKKRYYDEYGRTLKKS